MSTSEIQLLLRRKIGFILFTSSFIQDPNDDNKIKYEADTIIVKIYTSEIGVLWWNFNSTYFYNFL
jgi:hypothetical protein